jgi:hypothetical protein
MCGNGVAIGIVTTSIELRLLEVEIRSIDNQVELDPNAVVAGLVLQTYVEVPIDADDLHRYEEDVLDFDA